MLERFKSKGFIKPSILENGTYTCIAASKSSLETMNWLKTEGFSMSAKTMGCALKFGNPDIILCLKEFELEIPSDATTVAASQGSWKIVKWLH